MSSTYLNHLETASEPRVVYHRYRWSWHWRIHVLMLILLIGMATFPLAAWSWHGVTISLPETADAAGVAAHTSTAAGKRWTAVAPQCDSTVHCFVRQFLTIARQGSQDTGWPVSLELAQWGLEHGYRIPDFDGFNLGNSLGFDTPQGVCFGYGTVTISTGETFCDAHTATQGLQIWEQVVLHAGYYGGVAAAAKSGGPKAAAQALGRSPWAGGHYDNGNGPGSSLVAIMDDFNLYQFDK